MQPSTTRCSKSSACASSRSARRTEKASCACRFPLNTARPVLYYNRDAFRRARLLGDARQFRRHVEPRGHGALELAPRLVGEGGALQLRRTRQRGRGALRRWRVRSAQRLVRRRARPREATTMRASPHRCRRKASSKRCGAARRARRRRSRATRAASALEARAHELLALVALELLVARLLVAILHAALLLLLRRGGGGAAALQAGAHELLALVALLVGRALVAFLHARLLFLLRGGRFLVFLVLRVGGRCGKGEANCSDHESHCGSSSSSRSMALTSLASSGSTRVP